MTTTGWLLNRWWQPWAIDSPLGLNRAWQACYVLAQNLARSIEPIGLKYNELAPQIEFIEYGRCFEHIWKPMGFGIS